MSAPEIRWLVRMLRYQGRLDDELLRSILKDQPEGALLEELLRRGIIDETWAERAREIVRRKSRKSMEDPEVRQQFDRSFGQLALGRGWLAVGELESAILEQQRLQRLNLRFRIGEILVRAGVLSPDQVREVLAEQGLRMQSCSACAAVINTLEKRETPCPLCGGPLEPTIFLESVRTDAVVETS